MESESNTGPGFAIAFLAGILLLAIVTRGEDGETKPLFTFPRATSTEEARGTSNDRHVYIAAPDNSSEPVERLSNAEIERHLADTLDDIDDLEKDLRELKIWGEVSPHAGEVSLRRGNVRTAYVDSEYLIITASTRNERAINITDWAVESYVTERRRWIEEGVRVYVRGRINKKNPIWLEPGERAYIITGDSPVGLSFHENICTGYLTNHQDFIPRLSRACPRPFDEMDDFADIRLDDDSCWEFVEDIRRCEVPVEEEIEDADLSRNCERFVEREFGYNACVENHRFDPYFDEGDWYIYLDREEEMWRPEREIIKLTDRERRTVDVIEY